MLNEGLTGCNIDAGGHSMYRQGHKRECPAWKEAGSSMYVELIVKDGGFGKSCKTKMEKCVYWAGHFMK